MDVHLRYSLLHRTQNVAIVELGKIPGEPALNTDLSGPKFPGLDGFLSHFVEGEEVRVGFARSAAKGAELASDETDIREIDVAVYDVGDDIAREFGSKHVSRDQKAEQVVSISIGERVRLFE